MESLCLPLLPVLPALPYLACTALLALNYAARSLPCAVLLALSCPLTLLDVTEVSVSERPIRFRGLVMMEHFDLVLHSTYLGMSSSILTILVVWLIRTRPQHSEHDLEHDIEGERQISHKNVTN